MLSDDSIREWRAATGIDQPSSTAIATRFGTGSAATAGPTLTPRTSTGWRRRGANRHAHHHGAPVCIPADPPCTRVAPSRGGSHRPGATRPWDDLHGVAVPGRVPHRAVWPADGSERPALDGVRAADRHRPGRAGGRGGSVHRDAARRRHPVPAAGVVHAVPSPVRRGVRPGRAGTDRRAAVSARHGRHAPRPCQPWRGRSATWTTAPAAS